MMRMEAGRSIPKYDILAVDNKIGCFQVKSQSGNDTYNLNFGDHSSMPHCDCADWRNNYLPCKHFISIFWFYSNWGWGKLPSEYKDSPLLCLDWEITQNQSSCQQENAPILQDDIIADEDFTPNATTVDENSSEETSDLDVLELPRKKHSARSEAAKVREVLNEIRSLSFLVDDPKAISDLLTTMQKAKEEFRRHTQLEEGLDLEVEKVQKQAKVSKVKESKSEREVKENSTHPLPTNKSKHKYSGRTGEVAGMMKKMYKVSKGINDLFTEDEDNWKEELGHEKKEIRQMEVDPEDQCISKAEEEDDVIFVREDIGISAKQKQRKLHAEDISIIKNGQMLTDNAINIAQNILHEQYPMTGGLEDTVLGPCLNFSVATGEFVQVLHDGALHWICVSNIGCKEPGSVNVYDSLNMGHIALQIQKQVASMLFHGGPVIKFDIQPVQQQEN